MKIFETSRQLHKSIRSKDSIYGRYVKQCKITDHLINDMKACAQELVFQVNKETNIDARFVGDYIILERGHGADHFLLTGVTLEEDMKNSLLGSEVIAALSLSSFLEDMRKFHRDAIEEEARIKKLIEEHCPSLRDVSIDLKTRTWISFRVYGESRSAKLGTFESDVRNLEDQYSSLAKDLNEAIRFLDQHRLGDFGLKRERNIVEDAVRGIYPVDLKFDSKAWNKRRLDLSRRSSEGMGAAMRKLKKKEEERISEKYNMKCRVNLMEETVNFDGIVVPLDDIESGLRKHCLELRAEFLKLEAARGLREAPNTARRLMGQRARRLEKRFQQIEKALQ